MRRLPVYFVIDVSDSMVGEPLKAVKDGLSTCMEVLRADPYAIETAFINVITFAGKVEKPVDMEEAYLCHMPELNVGSGTSFGKALEFLMKDIDENVRKSTAEVKGDWRPIVILFTDGAPTDNYRRALDKWKKSYARKCNTIAIALGKAINLGTIGEMTEDVVRIADVSPAVIKRVFKWISSSVQTCSASVGSAGEENFTTNNLDIEGVDRVERDEMVDEHPAENTVLIHGQCEETKKHYLIKYERDEGSEFYQLVGAYPIDGDRYEALSAGKAGRFEVEGYLLKGDVTCPCCGNDLGLVKCGNCGQVQCASSRKGHATCPWCGNRGQLGSARLKFGRSLG